MRKLPPPTLAGLLAAVGLFFVVAQPNEPPAFAERGRAWLAFERTVPLSYSPPNLPDHAAFSSYERYILPLHEIATAADFVDVLQAHLNGGHPKETKK